MKWVGRLFGAAAALAVGYLAFTAVQVFSEAESGRTDVRPAQAIVVLGAAQYDGRPSPVLQSRLDHAAELYAQDVAPLIVVTGGSQPGDRSREATVSAAYLIAEGVPEQAIRREVDGRNTWEQLAASARFLADEAITDVVLVSDPLHNKRLLLIAREVGLDAQVSATPDSRIAGTNYQRMAVRETLATSLGRLISFRRMTNLDQALTDW